MSTNLIYTASGLDRQATRRTDADWLDTQENRADMRVIPVWRDKNLLDSIDTAPLPLMPSGDVGTRLLNAADTVLFLGLIDGAPVFGADLSSLMEEDLEILLGPNPTFVDLRATGWLLPRNEAAILAYARGLAIGIAHTVSADAVEAQQNHSKAVMCANARLKPADVNLIRAPTQP